MRSLLFLFVSLSLGLAQAAPAVPDSDDLDNFINQSLVLSQITNISKTVGTKASDLVVDAMGFLGVPYRYGGNNAQQGFDCSGLVRAVFEQTLGKVLPRRARDQAQVTQPISESELQPGDLVFFDTMRQKFSHVGIYVGNHMFIHSPHKGEQVRMDDMRQAYWERRFAGARRVNKEMNSE